MGFGRGNLALRQDFRDIATSWIDFRFRGKNGHAADITGMTESDPNPSTTEGDL
jgi:hypothetical protein